MTQLQTENVPLALLRDRVDLPIVDMGGGAQLQMLQVDYDYNMRVSRAIFAPGFKVNAHRHTGYVHAWTLSGSWKYIEYPEVNIAGSYLFEPAGSTHTLVVPEDNTEPTEVLFVVHGTNLELGPDGTIVGVSDAQSICDGYLARCAELGLRRPNVIGLDPENRLR